VTPAALVAELQARGVTLRPEGQRLTVQPASRVTADELATLRRCKAEVMALLARVTTITLDPSTVEQELGRAPSQHDVNAATSDVLNAVAQAERESMTGALDPRPILVRGRPLADWLSLDTIAQLLRLARPPKTNAGGRPGPASLLRWPSALAGLGGRRVGPFVPCADCSAGTWARYGDRPLCLGCANAAQRSGAG
jgi:hypothetical protein